MLVLGTFDLKVDKKIKMGINEVAYRSSFIVSIPENYIQKLNIKFREHIDVYKNYKKKELLFDELKKKQLSNEFLISENNRLRELINESIQSKDIYAKVLIDRDSPYLKSIILNKGSKDNVKLGMAVLDDSYLVGKIIEVNYTNSRVLLLSDLNSKIPVLLEPQSLHAVLSGSGKNHGVIEYTKEEYNNKLDIEDKIIVYTSGYGGLFKPGLPVGEITENKKIINFFSDFQQMDYVKIVSFEMQGED